MNRPTIVCLCGSMRVARMAIAAKEIQMLEKGLMVLLPCAMAVDLEREGYNSLKEKADAMHRHKIRLADRVHVVNEGGYIGESTRGEIEFAKSIGKPVTYEYPPNP